MGDYWLVLCRVHGLVGSGVVAEYYAHRLADQHEHHVGGGCDLRVLTEDDWEELKLAGELDEPEGSNRAIGLESP